MLFRVKVQDKNNFENINDVKIENVKLKGEKVLKDKAVIKDIKAHEVILKPQRQIKDKKAPNKIKVKFNKYQVKNDMKVDLAFNSSKQKTKIRTEFFLREGFKKCRGYILSGAVTAAIAVAIVFGINMTGYKFGSEVIVDGETIGLVNNKDQVYEAINSVKQDLYTYSEGKVSYEKEPTFIARIVGPNETMSVNDIKNKLMSKVDYLVQGYGIYIDNDIQVAVVNEEAANYVLAQHKKKFVGDRESDDSVVEFDKTVEIKDQFVPIAILKTAEGALRALETPVKKQFTFIAGENDTIWSLSKAYGVTADQIKNLNPDMGDVITVGSSVVIEADAPLLGVRFTHNIEYNEEIPYDTQKVETEDLYKGRMQVVDPGQKGNSYVMAKVTEINGIEVNRNILQKDVIAQPKTQVEKHGVKEPPRTLATGSFLRPAYGSLSSRYGARWGRTHKGLDIAGAHGSAIKAADGGIVTFSGWESGYGYYVVIDHENGYQTAYGHCSSLDVNKGDRVAKGDVIAKMGNTGNSTGTHLHFEVKLNGNNVDPAPYVGY